MWCDMVWKMEEEWIRDNCEGVLGGWGMIEKYRKVLDGELRVLKV